MTGDTVGGVWTFALELAEALGAHGIEVVLAALGGAPSATQKAEASRIRNLYLLESEFKLEWMEDPWRDVEESGRWLLDLEEEFAPDVVHLNSFGHAALEWNTPVVLTAHSCVCSWWKAVKREPLPESWSRYHSLVKSAVHSADITIAPSSAMLRSLTESYGFEGGVVAPNGRNPLRFRTGPKEPFVLAAGRLWDEGKNVASVARCARRIEWPVYLAGGGAGFDGCHMLGRLSSEELAEWYARAEIYALPARYEPFGLSVLEAGLSGCALVLGDIPSLRENWDGAAAFVPPDDEDALESVIRELIGDPPRRRAMSERAYARALSFTPERMAGAYLAAYRRREAKCIS